VIESLDTDVPEPFDRGGASIATVAKVPVATPNAVPQAGQGFEESVNSELQVMQRTMVFTLY
jgi:hypothetical protein